MNPGRLRRAAAPALNPGGYTAAAAAVYAAVVMILNAVHHHGVIDIPVIIAALSAAAALLGRHAVTPVADPRAADGTPLVKLPDPVISITPAAGSSPFAQGGPIPPGRVPGEKTLAPPGSTVPLSQPRDPGGPGL